MNYCCPASFLVADQLSVVTGSEDGQIFVWDLQSKQITATIQAHQGL